MFSVAFLVRNPPMDRLALLIDYLRPVANEFVIVDTGSTERDIAIMRSWPGVKIVNAEWTDDFAAARNVALPLCTNEWTLILDPDELPSVEMMRYLREIIDAPNPAAVGYVFWTRNFWGGSVGAEAPYHWHTRVFRTGRGRFYRPVHELIELDGVSELSLRQTEKLPHAPREAYLIHSKSQQDMERDDILYARLGEESR